LVLRIPTYQELAKSLLEPAHQYWQNREKDWEILKYIKKLTPVERAAIAYVNNLYNIREFNPTFLKTLVTDMIKPVSGIEGSREDKVKLLKDMPEFIINLLFHIVSEDVKGKDVKFDAIEDMVLLDKLATTALHIYKKIEEQELLIDTFFRTVILPPNVADTKLMVRDAIVLSDTDSTCGTYQDWVQWYFGDIKFTKDATAVSAIIMTFVTQAIDHNLKTLATNMNVQPDKRDLLKMKNEYYWPLMAIYASKNYYAKVNIKEGFVFDSYKPEIKGPTLLGGAFPEKIKEGQKDLMKYILTSIEQESSLDINKVINKVIDLRVSSIKPAKAYSEGVKNSTYFQHLLWNGVFSKKYGNAPEPEYKVVTIPTVKFSSSTIKTFKEEGKGNSIFLDRLDNFLRANNKKELKQFRVPMTYAESIGIPDELKDFVDYSKLLDTTMAGYYMILET